MFCDFQRSKIDQEGDLMKAIRFRSVVVWELGVEEM